MFFVGALDRLSYGKTILEDVAKVDYGSKILAAAKDGSLTHGFLELLCQTSNFDPWSFMSAMNIPFPEYTDLREIKNDILLLKEHGVLSPMFIHGLCRTTQFGDKIGLWMRERGIEPDIEFPQPLC